MRVVNAVNFHEVFEEHKDDVGKEARLLAEVCVLEEVEDLSGKSFKVLVVLQDFRHAQVAHLLAKAFAGLGHDVCLHAGVHVILDVDGVLLGDFHVHSDVVLVVGVFLLVWVQQVLVLLQVFDYFAVHSLVLQSAVQHNKHFACDCPVVQV